MRGLLVPELRQPARYVRADCGDCGYRVGEQEAQPGPRRRRSVAAAPAVCWRCGGHGPWMRLTEGPHWGKRMCESCGANVDLPDQMAARLVSAARELGHRLGGPLVGAAAELVAGLALGQATKPRRSTPKRVKAAMSSRDGEGGPRRGGGGKKGAT